MQLLVINQLIFEGLFKIRFCLMNVFVNGQWSMVKMPVAYYLLNVIYARIIQNKFSNRHSLFTIHHCPFTLQTLFSIHSLRHGFALLSPIGFDG